MRACAFCGKETNNPKFCSRSCSARQTNRTPKRKLVKMCTACGKLIPADRTFCRECSSKNRENYKNKTLEQMKSDGPYRKPARLRENARYVYNSDIGVEHCSICRYSKHIEVCHIKPISSFSATAKISEVNAIDNLIGLCPNCHWEFDHELISLVLEIS